jgi:hypothetical protein
LFECRDSTPEIEPIGWREVDYQRRKAQGDLFLTILETEGIAWEEFKQKWKD